MNWLKIAAVNLAIGVALGAFGAHGLKHFADPYAIDIWQKATLYLFVHALGLLAIGVLHAVSRHRLHLCAALMQAGIVIFGGSLYAIALGAPKWLGAITPIGGTLFILAWLTLAIKSPKLTHSPR
ncbi:DUF423 domain-containing protein [Moraxella marmotae]|uniref:DUF423 domain-containing protein n=1 Tax=Moraxella marmotae TaxID=3344520 RepID=UPI0035F4585E